MKKFGISVYKIACHTLTIKQVQALADISRSVLCTFNNKTCAPIANPPNSAQLEAPPPFRLLTNGSVQYCGNVAMDRQTAVTNIHFALAMPHAKCENVTTLLLLHPFNGLFSRTTWVSRHEKGKPFWVLLHAARYD